MTEADVARIVKDILNTYAWIAGVVVITPMFAATWSFFYRLRNSDIERQRSERQKELKDIEEKLREADRRDLELLQSYFGSLEESNKRIEGLVDLQNERAMHTFQDITELKAKVETALNEIDRLRSGSTSVG